MGFFLDITLHQVNPYQLHYGIELRTCVAEIDQLTFSQTLGSNIYKYKLKPMLS